MYQACSDLSVKSYVDFNFWIVFIIGKCLSKVHIKNSKTILLTPYLNTIAPI